jgi:RNA polymerase sigma-70 factor, ECF subfamily
MGIGKSFCRGAERYGQARPAHGIRPFTSPMTSVLVLDTPGLERCSLFERARKVRAMDDDAELMQRYASGDIRAFESLYSRHRVALYRYLARHARDPEIANDLFQEVWSKVVANRERYEPRAKFKTFLFRIAHNCFIDHYRRAALRPKQESPDGQDDWEDVLPAPEHHSPHALVENEELFQRYKTALNALPAEQREVFLLYEESGLSLDEIGAITGVGMETAKSRLRYAVSKLRAALKSTMLPPISVASVGEPGA